MPDGSLVTLSPASQACRPSLAEALERLIACAERGARPDAVLRDHGLLLRDRGEAG